MNFFYITPFKFGYLGYGNGKTVWGETRSDVIGELLGITKNI